MTIQLSVDEMRCLRQVFKPSANLDEIYKLIETEAFDDDTAEKLLSNSNYSALSRMYTQCDSTYDKVIKTQLMQHAIYTRLICCALDTNTHIYNLSINDKELLSVFTQKLIIYKKRMKKKGNSNKIYLINAVLMKLSDLNSGNWEFIKNGKYSDKHKDDINFGAIEKYIDKFCTKEEALKWLE